MYFVKRIYLFLLLIPGFLNALEADTSIVFHDLRTEIGLFPSANRLFLRNDGENLLLAILQKKRLYLLNYDSQIEDSVNIEYDASYFCLDNQGKWYFYIPERSSIAIYERHKFINFLPALKNKETEMQIYSTQDNLFVKSGKMFFPILQGLFLYHPDVQPEFGQDSLIVYSDLSKKIIWRNSQVTGYSFSTEIPEQKILISEEAEYLGTTENNEVMFLQNDKNNSSAKLIFISPLEMHQKEYQLNIKDHFLQYHLVPKLPLNIYRVILNNSSLSIIKYILE